MNRTKISMSLKPLDDLRRGLASQYVARVGILGDHAQRKEGGPMSNADIGLLMIFGSIKNNIPARDFLLMPIEHKRRELIAQLRASPEVKAAIDKGDFVQVYKIVGILAEQIVQEAFDTGGFGAWPPNAPATVDAKGSAKPLIDTSQLRRAVTSDVVKRGQA